MEAERYQGPLISELEARLTLKDRINYPYLLGNAILTFQKAILNVENSDREIREAIEGLIRMIPGSWKDAEFNKEYEAAKITRKTDLRPVFCGVPATLEWCKQQGIPIYLTEITFDYYAIFQAAIDLLERRGMLSKKVYTEKMTGKRYKGPAADISVLDLEELG